MTEINAGRITIFEPDGENDVEIEIDDINNFSSEYVNIFDLKKWIDEQVVKIEQKINNDK